MITIKIPATFFQERKYVLEYLFHDIYETEFFVSKSEIDKMCIIVLDNGTKIFIEDHFFNKFQDSDSEDTETNLNSDMKNKNDYIHHKNIPKRVQLCKNEFTVEKDIPVIYGKNEIVSSSTQLVCKIDIISSLFFLLSRWEEVAILKKDKHGRFSEMDSLLFRNNLLNRPVANEYIEMLWNMVIKLDPDIKNNKKKRVFKISLSHDIDELKKYKSTFQIVKKLFGDLFIRFSFKDFIDNLIEVIQVKSDKIADPYLSFSSLMNLSEETNSKGMFFFKTGRKSVFDRNRYNFDTDDDLTNIINEIIDRGHDIALHYSYLALLDKEGSEQKKISFLRNEKSNLEKSLTKIYESKDEEQSKSKKISIISERIHFLRFSVEKSFNKLNEIGITEDYSMGFSLENGFRAGICYEYPLWNFEKREKFANLKEFPLILMDTVMLESKNYTPKEQRKEIQYYYDIVKKYNGNFTFLIHNSTNKKFLNLVYEVIKIMDRRKSGR